jgi:predicted DCC family thiol-disulfide oxidoreductase YuxK
MNALSSQAHGIIRKRPRKTPSLNNPKQSMASCGNRGVLNTLGSKKFQVVVCVIMALLIKSVHSFSVLPSFSRRSWTASGGLTKHFASVSGDNADFSERNPNVATQSSSSAEQRLFPEELNVLYDSKCNVCKLEMEWLARRDTRINKKQPKLKLTDLEDPNFDAKDPANGGINYETGMSAIYAVTADGKILKGVPAFALAYEQVGLGWLWGVYNVQGIRQLFNWGYNVFAKYRTRLTRGSTLDELVALYKEKKRQLEKDDCEACNKM